jgi:membrane-associated protease RseP (regulator of RpoE activity)
MPVPATAPVGAAPLADRPSVLPHPPPDHSRSPLSELGHLEVDPARDGWGTLVVDVVDEQGFAIDAAVVLTVDCSGGRIWRRPGDTLDVPVGSCTVRAMRRDGALHTFGEPETVEVGSIDPAYVLLELPGARKGGIGVRFMPEEDGMRVMEVVPDSPAADAGLAAGDLVLDVAGQPTAGMETSTFVELMTGAEGSDVTFTVGWSGDTGLVEETLTVARRFLDG